MLECQKAFEFSGLSVKSLVLICKCRWCSGKHFYVNENSLEEKKQWENVGFASCH